jgi:two-component system, OmpR family, sensor histidine kinase KdpD
MTDNRPNPDELLNQIEAETLTTTRGKLKIFFGSSAGVGKTYDMLMAARQAQAQGFNVLVGIVETHGRSETAALLEDLTILPLKQIDYRGQTLKEFDIDAALAIHPDILLVDELAHSNVPTSRHPKRWQDVEELINAGINVYTTLNVQHLESVNDVVNQITGIAVRETLPDWFFDAANEVVLVDLPADELLTRLEEGKVYLPNQAKNAVKNFFRKGNLIALRELALRRTADRVDTDMRNYRKQARISPIWNTTDQLLVGLSSTGNNERLIRHAARLAGSLHTKWYVTHVETPSNLSKNKQKILDALRLAEDMGATTQIITANSVAEGLTSYAHQFNIGRIVIGQQRPKLGCWRNSLIEQIGKQDTKLDLIIVNQVADTTPNTSASLISKTPNYQELWANHNVRGYLVATVGCTLVTASLAKLTQWLDLANVLMLYLLIIVFVSVRFGRFPGIFAVIVSVLSFDFFILEISKY